MALSRAPVKSVNAICARSRRSMIVAVGMAPIVLRICATDGYGRSRRAVAIYASFSVMLKDSASVYFSRDLYPGSAAS